MIDEDQDNKPTATGERPTLKTISRLTGLAVATVSRALNGAPDISEATKERVRECAKEIGYRPNRAGVRLRTGKTNVISLVMSTDNDVMNHTAKLLASVAGGLRGTPYHLIVTPYFPDEDPMKAIRYIVETRSADGIVLNQIEPKDPRVAYLIEQGFPFITHGRSTWADQHPYVDFDNSAFAALATETFHKRGRKCVLGVLPPLYQAYGRAMLDTVAEKAPELDMQRLVLQDVTSDSTMDAISASVSAALRMNPDIDCIICGSINASIAAATAAEDLGKVIGKDIDICSKEASPFLIRFRKEIITIREDVVLAGGLLAKGVLQAINAPSKPPFQHLEVPDQSDLLLPPQSE